MVHKSLDLLVIFALLFCSQVCGQASVWISKNDINYGGVVYRAKCTISEYDNNLVLLDIHFYSISSFDKENYAALKQWGFFRSASQSYSGTINVNSSENILKIFEANEEREKVLSIKQGVIENITSNSFFFKIVYGNGNSTDISFSRISPVANSISELYKFLDEGYTNKRNAVLMKPVISDVKVNFTPSLMNSIVDKELPPLGDLTSILQNNTEFSLNINKELYLEILSSRYDPKEFSKDDMTILLSRFDKDYEKYRNNEFVIDKKTQAFYNLIQESCKNINLGDIHYVDFEVDLKEYDFNNQRFQLLADEYMTTYNDCLDLTRTSLITFGKRTKVYLSNWRDFIYLNTNRDNAENILNTIGTKDRKVTLRIYFLIAPEVIYNYGQFDGLIAYALKADLLKECPYQKLETLQSQTNLGIAVKECYSEALDFLNRETNNSKEIITNPMLESGFTKLLSWTTFHPKTCEKAFFEVHSRFLKVNSEDRVLELTVFTNYYTAFSKGYEIRFSNPSQNLNFPLVVSNVSGDCNNCVKLSVKIKRETIERLIRSQINQLTIQLLGQPKYQIGDLTIFKGSDKLKFRLNEATTLFTSNQNGYSDFLVNTLKAGL